MFVKPALESVVTVHYILNDIHFKSYFFYQGRHKKDPRKAKSETNAPTSSPRKEEQRMGGARQTKLPKIIPHRAVSVLYYLLTFSHM